MARPTISKEQKQREGALLRARLEHAKALEEGLTQESLAAEMEMTQGTLGQWLTGKTAIPDRRLIWLGKRLGFDPGEFRPELSEYYGDSGQSAEEKRIIAAYRADPEFRRVVTAVAEMSPFYRSKGK